MCEFSNPGKTDTKKVVCKQALPHLTAAGAATLSCSPWVTPASNMLHNSAIGDYGKNPVEGQKKKRAGQGSSYPYKTLINTLKTFAKHLGSPNHCNCFVYTNWYPFIPSSSFKFVSSCPKALPGGSEFHRQWSWTNSFFHQEWIHHL